LQLFVHMILSNEVALQILGILWVAFACILGVIKKSTLDRTLKAPNRVVKVGQKII